MRILILITLLFCCSSKYGEAIDVLSMQSNVVNRLLKADSTFSVDYTNNLSSAVVNTSGSQKASFLAALAIAMFDRYDETGDAYALDNCAVICSNIIYNCGLSNNSWQKAVGSIVYASTFSADGKHLNAYAICTNAINCSPYEPQIGNEKQLWDAMCFHHSSCRLSVADALRFYSAMSLFLLGDFSSNCCDIYTNALPKDAMSKIRQVLK